MKGLTLFATIALGLIFVSATYSEEPLEEFFDKDYDYSIKHPSTWKARIYRSGLVLADITSQDNQSGLQVRITHSKERPEQFVDQYLRTFMIQMQALLINKTQKKIGSINGYTITFRAKRGGADYFLKSYILPVKSTSKIFIFQVGAPFKARNRFEPILDSIADSFRLSNNIFKEER